MKRIVNTICYFIPTLVILNGCATLSSLWPFGSKKTEASETKSEVADESDSVKAAVERLVVENEKNKQILATNQMEIQSLREQLRTAKRNLQVLNRATRSGLFYDDPDTESAASPAAPSQRKTPSADTTPPQAAIDVATVSDAKVPAVSGAATKPSDAIGRTGFSDEATEASEKSSGTPASHTPAAMLADAEQKIMRAEFGDAVVTLSEMQNKFPNYSDNGQGLLLLAEAWLNLKNYNNVFAPVRNYYLKYPTNPDILRAKYTEAQALEGLGSTERATQLYREVIGSGPQTSFAQKARAALVRLRDSY